MPIIKLGQTAHTNRLDLFTLKSNVECIYIIYLARFMNILVTSQQLKTGIVPPLQKRSSFENEIHSALNQITIQSCC